jgi:RNA polymerase sigma factor (sigma-70 family)
MTLPKTSVKADHGSLETLAPLLRGLIGKVLRLNPTHDDVAECMQESFRRALSLSNDLSDERRRLITVGIARHVALDFLRSRGRSLTRFGKETVEPDSLSRTTTMALQEARVDANRVLAAIATLPEGQRRAISMHLLEQCDYRTIAEELEVPMGTVATWILRAKRSVTEALSTQASRSTTKAHE